MNNGAWNHQRPSCEAVECEENLPNVTLSSNMKLGSVYQDIAVYTCEDGYIPDNEPTSFCQHTGTWSTPNFTCTESNSAGGFPSSIATVVGSVAGAILVIVIVIVLIIIFCKRRSNESATTKSKWKESDSSSQYENPVFSQSKTDAHTYQGLNTITHTYQDCNTDVQSYDDTADPRTYEEPDQEANYEEVNGSKEKNYVNDAMIKQNKVLLC
ncbi:complement component receptor 1-like protein isoform X2 [Strongylocentrotus purpuratus]|uniref:Sushi domain-containing protein n=1 Tax=Strongylocentrotus purpuratus TaxID=7668 RepID=A0A7M7NA66_STRPU|nr:complement component receptor 1-like protein isoform X2 [Strongylocentrotus purpuratus]